MNSVKQREARILSKKIRDVGQVFQVTYRVPAGLITRVNGCYNDGATTLKFNSPSHTVYNRIKCMQPTDPRFARLCGEQSGI